MRLRAGIYDPYLDTLGGGERYVMTAACCLVERGWQVEVFWDNKTLKEKLEKRFNFSLGEVKFSPNIFRPENNLFERWRKTKVYDLIFYLSDGSIPFLFAKKNILHFQVPFTNVRGRSFLNKLKLAGINNVVCNSKFTKKFIDREYGVKSMVVYPPVDVESFNPGGKENIILAVGRFSQTLHAKKQEVLIEAFKNLWKKGIRNWRLILAGGLREEDKDYFNRLKKMAGNLPIELLPNLSFNKLKEAYSKSKIFWHAAGFGEDKNAHPEKMEHFGIVVIEAMAGGGVPVVINKGGIPEIVTDEKDGFLWQTEEELKSLTLQLIKSPEKLEKISLQSIKVSKRFSKRVFCQKMDEIIKS